MTAPEQRWNCIKENLPPGTQVVGRVSRHERFGFFIVIRDCPDAVALVEITEFSNQVSKPVDLSDFPPVDTEIEAEVFYHSDRDRQLRLFRVREV